MIEKRSQKLNIARLILISACVFAGGFIPPASSQGTPVTESADQERHHSNLTPANPDDPELAFLPPEVRREYVVTPLGLIHKSCDHLVLPGETELQDGSIKEVDGTILHFLPCQYPFIRWKTPAELAAPAHN